MHALEAKATTNTARLATLALTNSELRLRGLPNAPMPTAGLCHDPERTLVLFPSFDSTALEPSFVESLPSGPITLLVPDGTWRQASKLARREPALRGLRRVRVADEQPSRYRLRRAPGEHCLATFEAIARALGALEGPSVQAELEAVFDAMVERTLESRYGNALPEPLRRPSR